MKRIIIDKTKCESYKTFYETVYNQLDFASYSGWKQCVSFNYNADMLNEFLLHAYNSDNVEFVMENFIFDNIVNPITQDDCQWQLIFKVLDSLLGDYSRYELSIVNGIIHLVIDKNECESYKTFYEIVYKQLNGKGYIDWEQYENLHYSADMLNEFLWYAHTQVNTEFVMVNFDIDRIKEPKTYDDYEWQLVFEILDEFVKKYPENKLIIENSKS